MSTVYAYACIAVVLMAAMYACGYILATEQIHQQESDAIDYEYFKDWCWRNHYTKEQELAAFEVLYEVIKRLA